VEAVSGCNFDLSFDAFDRGPFDWSGVGMKASDFMPILAGRQLEIGFRYSRC
jgi:hypothetical protein